MKCYLKPYRDANLAFPSRREGFAHEQPSIEDVKASSSPIASVPEAMCGLRHLSNEEM
jgi:hypothetical protein